MNFLKGVASEIKNITWPSQNTVWFYTVAVIVITAILAGYIYGLDTLFVKLLDFIV